MKIPAAKAAVDKEMGKMEKIFGVELDKKSEVNQRWSMKQGTVGRKSSFCITNWTICHLKKCWVWRQKHQKYKGRVVLRSDIVKDIRGLMQYSLNMDHQHLKWQPQKSWVSSPDCQVAMDKQQDAISAYTQVKMEDAHKLLKIPKSECPDIWIRLPRHKWPKSWSSMEGPSRSSWTKSVWSSFGRTVMGKAIWEKSFWSTVGRKFQIGNVSLYIIKKGFSYLCMWMT